MGADGAGCGQTERGSRTGRPFAVGTPVIMADKPELIWRNPAEPVRRWTGVDPMHPAAVAVERQAALLSQRPNRVVWLTDRQLWWFYCSE